MKILKIIGLTIAALIVLVLLVGLISPRKVQVERSISINAPAESIFEEIKGVKSLNAWSPWNKIDPEGTKYSYEGPAEGVGSKMSWTSDHPDVGSGSQEIVESEENSKVRMELYFEGFEEPNYADIIITPDDGSSTVKWTFDGDMGANPIGKIFGLFMDGMLGPSYEEGLENLKKIVEAKPTFSVEIGIEQVEPINYLCILENFDLTAPETIGPRMGEIYGQLTAYLQKNDMQMTGMPFSVYQSVSETSWETEVAVPIAEEVMEGSGDINPGTTTGGKTVKAVHKGDYHKLAETHAEVAKYMEYKKLTSSGNPYEVYVTDPMTEPDTAKWVSLVYYPVN